MSGRLPVDRTNAPHCYSRRIAGSRLGIGGIGGIGKVSVGTGWSLGSARYVMRSIPDVVPPAPRPVLALPGPHADAPRVPRTRRATASRM